MTRSIGSLAVLSWPRVVCVVLVGAAVVCSVGLWAGAQDRDDRESAERPKTEREVVLEQIEVMKLAMPALREADRKDAVELIERAIHARQVLLEGRRDDEARMIREKAPSREQLAEILGGAARLWNEFGNEDKAKAVGQLARTFAARGDRPVRDEARRDRPVRDEVKRDRPVRDEARRDGDERAVARRQLELMKMALPALREADRKDAVELLERAIRAREVTLEGRRDDEAQMIRERAPSRQQLAEILVMAGRLWREFKNEEKATAISQLARQLGAARDVDRPRDRPARDVDRPQRTDRDVRRDAPMERIERLERRVAELAEAVEKLRAELRETSRKPD